MLSKPGVAALHLDISHLGMSKTFRNWFDTSGTYYLIATGLLDDEGKGKLRPCQALAKVAFFQRLGTAFKSDFHNYLLQI